MANDPRARSMWIARHSKPVARDHVRVRVDDPQPVTSGRDIATLDHTHRGRFGLGLVRGYQSRWVEQFKTSPELAPVGPWNKDSAEDDLNREHFVELSTSSFGHSPMRRSPFRASSTNSPNPDCLSAKWASRPGRSRPPNPQLYAGGHGQPSDRAVLGQIQGQADRLGKRLAVLQDAGRGAWACVGRARTETGSCDVARRLTTFVRPESPRFEHQG